MNTAKIIALTVFAITTLAVNLTVIQLLTRNIRSKHNEEGVLKLAVSIWLSALFIVSTIITSKSVNILNEAYDLITLKSDSVLPIFKISCLFAGLGVVWLIIWHYISGVLSFIPLGNRIDRKEADANNLSYFLLRGILFIGFIFCLAPVFEIILRFFLPSVEVPFYH